MTAVGKGGAPLQIPLRIRAKLDALDWDAHGLIWSIWMYHQDVGYSGRFHVDELPAAHARRLTKSREQRALAALMRGTIEHRDGAKSPLWLDLVDDHITLPDWFLEENPPADLWHDDTERERRRVRRELHSPKCAHLREQVKRRDRNLCRYCGIRVNWSARNSDDAATYDHVDPDEGNTLGNVVVACRRCNGRKNHRTPDQWVADGGVSLLRPGTTAEQAGVLRAREGPAPPARSSTQVRPGSNPSPRSRARPPRVEPESDPSRTDPKRSGAPRHQPTRSGGRS